MVGVEGIRVKRESGLEVDVEGILVKRESGLEADVEGIRVKGVRFRGWCRGDSSKERVRFRG